MNKHRVIEKELINRDKVIELVRGHVPEWIELNIEAMDADDFVYECEDYYDGICTECKYFANDDFCVGCINFDDNGTNDKWEWDCRWMGGRRMNKPDCNKCVYKNNTSSYCRNELDCKEIGGEMNSFVEDNTGHKHSNTEKKGE